MTEQVIYAAKLPAPTDGAATDPNWYCRLGAYTNLALLLQYLDSHGIEYGRPSDVLYSPWKWTPEWRDALAWRDRELAA